MILDYLITFLSLIAIGILGLFPNVSMSSIPFIGEYLIDPITHAVGYYNLLAVELPYLYWSKYFFVGLLSFEIALWTAKLFLGARHPYST